jgi:hypothetical protein
MEYKCRKTSFVDEKSARFYLAKIEKTSIKKKSPKDCYLCPNCMAWHLKSKKDEQHENTQRQINNLQRKFKKISLYNSKMYNFIKSQGYDIEVKHTDEDVELIFTKKELCLA